MDKSLAMRWVKALRSGKYKQGSQELKRAIGDSHEYCCLGVLADIQGKEIPARQSYLDFDPTYCGLKTQDGTPRFLNGKDAKVLGWDCLASANDEDITFKRIAAWIEKNYKKL